LEAYGNAQVSSAPVTITIQGADTAAVASLTAANLQTAPDDVTLVLAVVNNDYYLMGIYMAHDSAAQNQALSQRIVQSFQLTPQN
jgi:hypothetical protein